MLFCANLQDFNDESPSFGWPNVDKYEGSCKVGTSQMIVISGIRGIHCNAFGCLFIFNLTSMITRDIRSLPFLACTVCHISQELRRVRIGSPFGSIMASRIFRVTGAAAKAVSKSAKVLKFHVEILLNSCEVFISQFNSIHVLPSAILA